MFTHSCHINKNTKYIIDKLNILGRKFIPNGFAGWYIPIEDCKYLYCSDESFNGNMVYYYTGKMVKPSNSIWCGTNEELFLAIAALRDDSDIHQWFTNGKEWIQCEKEDWIDGISSLCVGGNYNYDKNCELSVDFHKATVEELIKHFTV